MKLRGRTLLVLALLIFGGYAIYDYRHDQNREKHAAEEALLLTVNSEQVDSVSLEKQGQKILLKRTVDGWNLEEPFKDLADNTAVEDLIKSVASEKIIDVAKEGENIDWSIFGLDKPLGTITFATNAGAKNVFQISSKRNFEENALARRDSEKRVLIINSVWQNRMNKTPLDFRDRRVLRHRMASIDSFKLKNEKGLMELVLQEGKWIAPAKKNLKLDQNKVHEILQSIADAKAAEYVEGALP
ncbi:MAG TPA: DUF4340 domain-containing protein, partial [Bdellovibrio sp.]|nr:DUF4340 domain-containing protein [Bdellovibrio sp.]